MKTGNLLSEKNLYFVMIILSILCAFILYGCKQKITTNTVTDNTNEDSSVPSESSSQNAIDFVITIDPGHGGFDPGKISNNGIKEKDINLSISLKLKQKLEEMGFVVHITRDTDKSLDDAGAKSKKMSDLNNRISFAAENHSDLMLSIHQNSFSAASAHGAQVFYYSSSEQGHLLAELIQEQIRQTADKGNERNVKGNSEYLLLAKSSCTALIVECGFLSNDDECDRLCSEEYQELMATAISSAVMEYYTTTQ